MTKAGWILYWLAFLCPPALAADWQEEMPAEIVEPYKPPVDDLEVMPVWTSPTTPPGVEFVEDEFAQPMPPVGLQNAKAPTFHDPQPYSRDHRHR